MLDDNVQSQYNEKLQGLSILKLDVGLKASSAEVVSSLDIYPKLNSSEDREAWSPACWRF
jgi:hypothetical protein